MKYLKFLLYAFITTVVCILIGFMLMILISLLPVEPIENNVRLSSYTLEREGPWPWIKTINGMQEKDNFTDALMMSVASNDKETGIVDQALLCEYLLSKKTDPYDSFYKYYNRPNEDKDQFYREPYPRYWHGYLVVLKPLLSHFRYYQIRKIFLYTQFMLVLAIIAGMFFRKLYPYITPFILSILLLSPSIIAQSMQFSWVYYVMLLACLCLLIFENKWKNERNSFIFFTVVGCMTSFVDLLTAPLLTIGFPLIIYLCMDRQKNMLQSFKKPLQLMICWGIGYAGMWIGKWIISSYLTDHNVIASALDAFRRRSAFTDSQGNQIFYFDILKKNWSFLSKSPIWPITVFIMFASLLISVFQKNLRQLTIAICRYGVLIIVPFMWFYLASNHTELHAYFTHRIYVVSFFAGMCLFVSGIKPKIEH